MSQRSLSQRVGIALGLTNLLVRRLVRKGWVRMIRVNPNRVAYLLTPAGLAAKARLSCAYFVHSTRFYAEARDRVLRSLERLSAEWPGPDGTAKEVVFFGAGEVAEIGFICLHETDLRLVAVVDETRTKPFFGLPVCPPEQASALARVATPPIVLPMSFEPPDALEERLLRAGIPVDRVFWI